MCADCVPKSEQEVTCGPEIRADQFVPYDFKNPIGCGIISFIMTECMTGQVSAFAFALVVFIEACTHSAMKSAKGAMFISMLARSKAAR
jgi:hypothetical protein